MISKRGVLRGRDRVNRLWVRKRRWGDYDVRDGHLFGLLGRSIIWSPNGGIERIRSGMRGEEVPHDKEEYLMKQELGGMGGTCL